ncbi:MAG TPA: NAD(P)H-hydrate dehydratase [Mycobacteriales bacterium]|nr:NAD(P)H-hydrate dehydratase [Mycobacteriales bacterium]
MPPAEPRAVTPALLQEWPLPEPDSEGGKHARGTVLVVGGAVSTPGAVLLAGLAALRVGAGKLKLVTVEATAVALGVAVPEAMVVGLPAGANGSLSPDCADDVAEQAGRADAVVVGPGLLGHDETGALLEALLPQLDEAAVVLDAVALTALAQRPHLAGRLAGRLALTPNSGEAAALLGDDGRTGRDAALAVAQRYGAAVACPGGVADHDGRVWSDESGGIGLGTSGSGDVMAGAVGGLLARGADPAQAVVFGQYLHGAAGDRLAAQVGKVGFLARELLDELPAVLTRVRD